MPLVRTTWLRCQRIVNQGNSSIQSTKGPHATRCTIHFNRRICQHVPFQGTSSPNCRWTPNQEKHITSLRSSNQHYFGRTSRRDECCADLKYELAFRIRCPIQGKGSRKNGVYGAEVVNSWCQSEACEVGGEGLGCWEGNCGIIGCETSGLGIAGGGVGGVSSSRTYSRTKSSYWRSGTNTTVSCYAERNF